MARDSRRTRDPPMPNALAYLVLFGWPVVVFVLFRRLPVAAALAWSIIAGYLLLPERTGFNLPMVPTIDKEAIPALAAFVFGILLAGGAAEAARRRQRGPAPRSTALPGAASAPPLFRRSPGTMVLQGLLVLAFAAVFLTVLQNDKPVVFGPLVMPGLKLYDAFSILGSLAIALLPFLMGRRYLATPESHVTLLWVLCISGLVYSLPALFEIRMSPQLNVQVYGFLNGSFKQQMRGGGFRPMVFLHHGLWLAIFTAMTLLAAAALWRQSKAEGKPTSRRWFLATLWLLMVLALSNSAGALLVGLALLPAVMFLGVRGQLLLAAGLATVILVYPMLRGAGLVPVETSLSLARSIDEGRANSLAFRFRNEDLLLARAQEKPLAGWGSWGRNRIYDDTSGRKVTTTDGMWIIVIGAWGWVGYIARYGLLTLPILFLAFNRRRLDVSFATSGLALIMVANLIDMIPNATLTPVTWLIGGALAGRFALAPQAMAPAPLVQEAQRPARARPMATREPPAPAALPAGRSPASRRQPV